MLKQNRIHVRQTKDKRISTDCTTEVVLTAAFSSSECISSKSRYIRCMNGENTKCCRCSIISYEQLRSEEDCRARYDATNENETILLKTCSQLDFDHEIT